MEYVEEKKNTIKCTNENILAEEALTQGNEKEAAGILLEIIETDPSNWRAYNNMGILAWTRKNWRDAYAMFKKAVLLNPEYDDALVNLFDAALKLKKVDEIKPLFEKAHLANPDDEDIKTIYDSINELGDGIYQTKRALNIGIYSPIIESAEIELEAGNYYAAMEKFLQSNDTEGPNAAAYCGLGIVSYYQQRYQDAYTLFVESIKLNPSDPDTFLNLYDAAKETGHLKSAKEIFNAYRKEFPELEAVAEAYDSIID